LFNFNFFNFFELFKFFKFFELFVNLWLTLYYNYIGMSTNVVLGGGYSAFVPQGTELHPDRPVRKGWSSRLKKGESRISIYFICFRKSLVCFKLSGFVNPHWVNDYTKGFDCGFFAFGRQQSCWPKA
jgi:hypothetical protein